MEQLRRQYLNEVKAHISRLEKAHMRDMDVLHDISRLGLSEDALVLKKKRLNSGIEERLALLTDLKRKEEKVLSGECDSEFMAKPIKVKEVKKKTIVEEEDEKKYRQHNFGQDNKRQKSDQDYGYRHFCSVVDTLPDYMKSNLKEMPGNKGYIWRGCWFFGALPYKSNQPTIMFEKSKGGKMLIHEIDSGEKRVYEKMGKEQKRLVSRMSRKKLVCM